MRPQGQVKHTDRPHRGTGQRTGVQGGQGLRKRPQSFDGPVGFCRDRNFGHLLVLLLLCYGQLYMHNPIVESTAWARHSHLSSKRWILSGQLGELHAPIEPAEEDPNDVST